MLALLFVPALGTPPETSEVFFEENFETYPVGSFPSDKFYTYWGGWSIAQENTNKFLRGGRIPGGNYLLFTRQKFLGNSVIDFMVRNFRAPQYGYVEVGTCLSSMVRDLEIALWVNSDGLYGIKYYWIDEPYTHRITLSDAPIEIQSGVWYNVKVDLNGSLARFYVDDVFIIEFDVSEIGFTMIEDFKLKFGSSHNGQRDLDDMLIYERESTIYDLIDAVESMNLQQGIENGLDAKLQNVQDSIEAFNADNRNDAINKLNAFVNAVEAQRGNKISNEQADYLIAEAQKLIDKMS